ncbi:hypothetical protein HDC94_000925 [Leifsonia sp. AK011]|uniref:hypothetical protein n=1 Tax=Leifsonia sp. AK011 TaxID=2723075 RepID=UPI0015C72AAA|nr:hypothetical protein [Leifsonia sp. AK011]NYF09769.1 hypothetical protein [Leifsonia sp. AK011]
MPAPTLTPELAEQLSRVSTSHDRSVVYAPCLVRLKSGEVLPRVYLVEESTFLEYWGEEQRRPVLDPNEIESIEESPMRMPAALATQIYNAHESGMGYFIFTVRLRNGSSVPFLTGNAVDFPDWPEGIQPSDAVAVEPHVGREHFQTAEGGQRSAKYVWCLYSHDLLTTVT